MRVTLLAWSLIACSATYALATEIPIVGLDQNHQPFVKNVPAEEYQARLTAVIGGADASIQPVLERQSCSKPAKDTWMLRTIAVGISVGVEGGLGPIVNASAKARFRLVYSNSKNPVFPD